MTDEHEYVQGIDSRWASDATVFGRMVCGIANVAGTSRISRVRASSATRCYDPRAIRATLQCRMIQTEDRRFRNHYAPYGMVRALHLCFT